MEADDAEKQLKSKLPASNAENKSSDSVAVDIEPEKSKESSSEIEELWIDGEEGQEFDSKISFEAEEDDDPDFDFGHKFTEQELIDQTVAVMRANSKKMPFYHDRATAVGFLVRAFIDFRFNAEAVEQQVRWFKKWNANPANKSLLEAELEKAVEYELERVEKAVQYLLGGGPCMSTLGRCVRPLICLGPFRMGILVALMICDLCLACCYKLCIDWSCGELYRKFILSNYYYGKMRCIMKFKKLNGLSLLFSDEELGIKNIYDSENYSHANTFVLTLFAAIVGSVVSLSLIGVSIWYMILHPTSYTPVLEFAFGLALLFTSSCLCQLVCRCTL